MSIVQSHEPSKATRVSKSKMKARPGQVRDQAGIWQVGQHSCFAMHLPLAPLESRCLHPEAEGPGNVSCGVHQRRSDITLKRRTCRAGAAMLEANGCRAEVHCGAAGA